VAGPGFLESLREDLARSALRFDREAPSTDAKEQHPRTTAAPLFQAGSSFRTEAFQPFAHRALGYPELAGDGCGFLPAVSDATDDKRAAVRTRASVAVESHALSFLLGAHAFNRLTHAPADLAAGGPV
jgi:hypothetical protein